MNTLRNILLLVVLFLSFTAKSQCGYENQFVQLSHVDCYEDSTGAIDSVILINDSASFWWEGPNGFTANSLNISNLQSGRYTLMIMANVVTGDTSTTAFCLDSVSFIIEQTLEISADFQFKNQCNIDDSADVITTLWGGTPPYRFNWSTGDSVQNTDNLAPSLLPYTLIITDTNLCVSNIDVWVNEVSEMNPFMSSVGVICKDDYSGSARVFVTEGTPPFQFQWSTDSIIIEHDSFSVIESLVPGEYRVKITDDMGCITRDTIEVKSNPAICITVYKVFSPNDDDIHEFWEIENIHLYPNTLVLVYDRNGNQVYRRRNYINAETEAFGGKDQNGQPLPSGTYYYIIDLENDDTVFKGALTIVR
jgi:gliding motility-associated-like protein